MDVTTTSNIMFEQVNRILTYSRGFNHYTHSLLFPLHSCKLFGALWAHYIIFPYTVCDTYRQQILPARSKINLHNFTQICGDQGGRWIYNSFGIRIPLNVNKKKSRPPALSQFLNWRPRLGVLLTSNSY